MERIKFVDLVKNYHSIKGEIDTAISTVLENASFILGQPVAQFEQACQTWFGPQYAVGVSSGTEALFYILKALHIGPNDEVILPANTFIATAEAVVRTGAIPVLVDMDISYTIDPQRAAAAVTSRTKAIIAVHLYGRPAAMDALTMLCEQRNIVLIEDACQAHGSLYKDRKCGTFGAAAALSFYPGKNLGGYGDGGMVLTNNHNIAEYTRKLRDHGSIRKAEHEFPGHTGRLDALQAAVLNVKLQYLDAWNNKRRKLARHYRQAFVSAEIPAVLPPGDDPVYLSNYHLFVIQGERRDALRDHLAAHGIESGIHYPVPIHLTPAFKYLGLETGSLPNCEKAAPHILSLPMFPELTGEQIDYIVKTIHAFYRR